MRARYGVLQTWHIKRVQPRKVSLVHNARDKEYYCSWPNIVLECLVTARLAASILGKLLYKGSP